jgi:transcriptional regulator with GAF, ATPase, and Fis domain
VLQDGFVERVGGGHAIHVDVRVVAATHRDLAQMVREGRFREDLWYRIAVFPILLPPLRERLGDIPALVEHFAEKAANRFGLPAVKPAVPDIELLKTYDWPGNIRELAAVIDRAAILGQGKSLDISAALGFSSSRSLRSPLAELGALHDAVRAPESGTRKSAYPTLDEANRRHIEGALREARGRVEGPQGAAALLDINPHTLRARMRKLGIEWATFRNES